MHVQSSAKAFEPAQATREERDRDQRVDSVLGSLEQAVRGEHVAWTLSNAMESVARHYRGNLPRITPEQRDPLLSAVVRAWLAAIEHLPISYPRDQIAAGMQALAGQVTVWAVTREQSSRRKAQALADLDAYARMVRNDLHNICLVEEIERRAWERREQHIQPLRTRK